MIETRCQFESLWPHIILLPDLDRQPGVSSVDNLHLGIQCIIIATGIVLCMQYFSRGLGVWHVADLARVISQLP